MSKISLSEEFKRKAREAWDRGSKAMVWLAQHEAWNLEVHGEDHDDQVSDAEDIGILVGKSRADGVEKFLELYTEWVNRYEED